MVTIRTRLFLTFLILAGLGFYFLVDWLVDDLRPRYLETMEESMLDSATVLAAVVSEQVKTDLERGIPFPEAFRRRATVRDALDEAEQRSLSARIYRLTKTGIDMRVYVTNDRGTVIFDSNGGADEGKDYSRWNDVFRTLRGQYGARTSHLDSGDPARSTLYVAAPVMYRGGIVGVLTVCKSSDSIRVFIYTAKKKIIAAGLVAFLSVIILCLIISFWITRPIKRLTAYARSVRDGKRNVLPDLGNNEIGELGTAFEQMRDALEGKQYVENYIQNLTHEMKSPLSAIRGAAEQYGTRPRYVN